MEYEITFIGGEPEEGDRIYNPRTGELWIMGKDGVIVMNPENCLK